MWSLQILSWELLKILTIFIIIDYLLKIWRNLRRNIEHNLLTAEQQQEQKYLEQFNNLICNNCHSNNIRINDEFVTSITPPLITSITSPLSSTSIQQQQLSPNMLSNKHNKFKEIPEDFVTLRRNLFQRKKHNSNNTIDDTSSDIDNKLKNNLKVIDKTTDDICDINSNNNNNLVSNIMEINSLNLRPISIQRVVSIVRSNSKEDNNRDDEVVNDQENMISEDRKIFEICRNKKVVSALTKKFESKMPLKQYSGTINNNNSNTNNFQQNNYYQRYFQNTSSNKNQLITNNTNRTTNNMKNKKERLTSIEIDQSNPSSSSSTSSSLHDEDEDNTNNNLKMNTPIEDEDDIELNLGDYYIVEKTEIFEIIDKDNKKNISDSVKSMSTTSIPKITTTKTTKKTTRLLSSPNTDQMNKKKLSINNQLKRSSYPLMLTTSSTTTTTIDNNNNKSTTSSPTKFNKNIFPFLSSTSSIHRSQSIGGDLNRSGGGGGGGGSGNKSKRLRETYSVENIAESLTSSLLQSHNQKSIRKQKKQLNNNNNNHKYEDFCNQSSIEETSYQPVKLRPKRTQNSTNKLMVTSVDDIIKQERFSRGFSEYSISDLLNEIPDQEDDVDFTNFLKTYY